MTNEEKVMLASIPAMQSEIDTLKQKVDDLEIRLSACECIAHLPKTS